MGVIAAWTPSCRLQDGPTVCSCSQCCSPRPHTRYASSGWLWLHLCWRRAYAESQIWQHPLHTYPGSGRSSSRSEALAPRVLLLVRLATTMSRSGSTASGTLTRGNVTRIPLRGGTVEWKQDWGASYMHMQSGCTLRLYRAPTCYV